MDFRLLSVNTTGIPNSVFGLSTRAESLNGTGGDSLSGNWLASGNDAEVAVESLSETKAYRKHIKKSELETRKVFEPENIQTENIPLK